MTKDRQDIATRVGAHCMRPGARSAPLPEWARIWRVRLLLNGALFLALLAGGCAQVWSVAEEQPPYRTIAYLFGGRADIDRISAHKLTHINYAFALVTENGELVFREAEGPSHLAQLQALKARNPKLKILVSVGGWGADHFSDAALTNESRRKFAASAVSMMKRYALDGIDIDWEYPGQPGPGIKFRPEDKQNFTLLLKTLREHLDASRKGTILTIASSAGEYFEHTEMDRLHVYLDWINIMTYDFAGIWTTTTGHHAGLYPTAAAFVRQHLAAGIPPDKLVLGVAFFGRGWTGVNPVNNGLKQPYQGQATEYPFSVLNRQYVNQQGFVRYWDSAARAPYLWDAASREFISYDDPESLKEKTLFIIGQELGGVMFWEYSQDPEEKLLDVLYDNLR